MKELNHGALLVFFTVLFFSCNNSKTAEEKTTATESDNPFKEKYNGKVKELTEESFVIWADSGKAPKSYLDQKVYNLYDENGNLLVKITYGEEGEQEGGTDMTMGLKTVYSYDDKGNWIGDSTIGAFGLEEFWVIKYDEKGNRVARNKFNADGTPDYRYVVKYDDKKRKVEEIGYGVGDSTWMKDIFSYDEKGNMVEQTTVDEKGKSYGKQSFKYDDKGNMIEKNDIGPDGTPEGKMTYKYDDKKRKIEEISYRKDNSGILQRLAYKYDDDGNEIEMLDSTPGNEPVTTITKYDKTGDKNGNWIKKTVFTGNSTTPDLEVERKFVYY